MSAYVFSDRLNSYSLIALDVGGGGDCFFRSVSHQLYGHPNRHLELRTAGVQYLANNPEQFIESNVETSWLDYLSNIALEGTWADHIIIQAVANAMNLKIHIIESNENFADVTIVEPSDSQNVISIFIGH